MVAGLHVCGKRAACPTHSVQAPHTPAKCVDEASRIDSAVITPARTTSPGGDRLTGVGSHRLKARHARCRGTAMKKASSGSDARTDGSDQAAEPCRDAFGTGREKDR